MRRIRKLHLLHYTYKHSYNIQPRKVNELTNNNHTTHTIPTEPKSEDFTQKAKTQHNQGASKFFVKDDNMTMQIYTREVRK